MWIPNENRVPDAKRLADVDGQTDDHHQIAEKSGQNRRAEDGFILLHIKYVHRGRQCESSGAKGNSGEHVETFPQPPREGVGLIGGCTQAVYNSDIQRRKASGHDEIEERLPKRQLSPECGGEIHDFVSLVPLPPSAASTSCRR